MWETCSPSEGGNGTVGGETRLQTVLGAIVLLLTFGRCVENVGKLLTFGRWERHGRWETRLQTALGAVRLLLTFGRWVSEKAGR